jgi:hypothetical protein
MTMEANHIDRFGWHQPIIEDDGDHVYVHFYQIRVHIRRDHLENVDTWVHEFMELNLSEMFGDVRLITYHEIRGTMYRCNPTVKHFLTSCFTRSGLAGYEMTAESFVKSVRICA